MLVISDIHGPPQTVSRPLHRLVVGGNFASITASSEPRRQFPIRNYARWGTQSGRGRTTVRGLCAGCQPHHGLRSCARLYQSAGVRGDNECSCFSPIKRVLGSKTIPNTRLRSVRRIAVSAGSTNGFGYQLGRLSSVVRYELHQLGILYCHDWFAPISS